MDNLGDYSPASVFIGGVASSLLVLTLIGIVAGFSVEPALQSEHSLFTYVHYLFVVGGVGGVLAVGWAKSLRIATIAGAIVVLGFVASSTPDSGQSIIHLTSRLGVASVVVPFGVVVEYVVKKPDEVRTALTPEAIRFGLVTGATHAGVVLAARGLLGFYEGGFVATVFTTSASIGVAVWSIGGLFLVGFVAGVLARRYGLISPLVSTGVLLIIATVRTWLRVKPDGPSGAIAAHLITLYSWTWPATLAVGIGFALLERDLLHKGRIPTSAS